MITFAAQPAHLCYTKATWSAAWVEAPLLQAHRIGSPLAPSHSSAQLSYRYGRAKLQAIGSRPADTGTTIIPRPDLNGRYLRIDVAGLPSWYGVLTDQEDNQAGVLDGVPSGVMSYTAFGVTRLLAIAPPVVQSVVKTTGSPVTIAQALPFNGGSDGRQSAGRVATANYDTSLKCFTDKTLTSSPALWRARDAIEYLLENFAPRDAGAVAQVTFVVGSASLDVLDYDLPYLTVHGKTLWQLINEIVDRRRGLNWWFIVNGSDELELVVDSSATNNISLPGGGTITANRNQFSLSYESAVNIASATLSTSALQYYDQIFVEGERVGVVFSVSPASTNGQLVPDWGSTEQTEYNAAASGDTGYSALAATKKAAANADFRARDDMSRVFSWWRLDLDWDGKARNEDGTNQPAIVTIDEDGVLDESIVAPFWLDGLRFESFVPLLPGVDYTGAVTPATSPADDQQRDYIPPAVWFQLEPVNTEVGSNDDGWVHCERINAAVDSGDVKREYQWSVQLRLRQDAPGVVLEVVGGQQHYVAQDLYTSNGSFEDIPSNEGVDHRSWIATVYAMLQQSVFAVYPLAASVGGGDCLRVLRIPVADAHLDYLVEGTVVGVTSGELQQTAGGLLRDDRDRLKDIARLAYAWYGTPRKTLSLNFRAIAAGLDVGSLITTVVESGLSQTVNTVISNVSYDLDTGSMSLQTAFAEIDFAGLIQ